MKRAHARVVLALPALIFALLGCGPLLAQAPLEPARLPARTLFYFVWRGAPSGQARTANSLLALWDDPDLAPLRSSIFTNMQSGPADPARQPLTREEMEQFATLLENPFVVGYVPSSNPKARAVAATPNPATNAADGFFFVYDQTGKEALLAKAMLRSRSQEKDPPQITQVTIAGAPALKIERKSGTMYWAEHGKYAVSTGDVAVFQDILARLDGKSDPANSLAQASAYQESQTECAGGLAEAFLRISQLKDLVPVPDGAAPGGFKPSQILDALHVDAFHSVCARLTLDGAKTRLHGAILGDASAGTLFDLWGAGLPSPASLPLVPAGVVSYSQTQINLAGIYDFVKQAIRASLPPAQKSGTDMMEALAAGRIGMPVPEALNLLTGEFAYIQSSPAMDPQNAVYFLGIRKKPDALKLLRGLFGDRLTSERNEGDTTFFNISLSGTQNTSGVAQWNFYHAAVTPSFILASSRIETLRDFLARASRPGAPDLPRPFVDVRAQFPQAASSVSFFDFGKVDWPALKTRWAAEAQKAKGKPGVAAPRPNTLAPAPNWFDQVNLEVFPRHLHFAAGGSWKDAKGTHFDEWIE